MDVDAIRESPVGRLVPITGTDPRDGAHYDHWAFLPDPLPDVVDLSPTSWMRVVEAESALARLDEAATLIPEPRLLIRPSLRREAQSTSALEGTYAPFDAILESDIDGPSTPEIHEVLNFVEAATAGFDWMAQDRPFSIALLGDLQRLLVRDTASEQSDAGGLRDRQVMIGPSRTRIADSRYVPPPPGQVLRDGVEDWVRWVTAPPDHLPRVVRAALAHYQFETLHPFSDGNGRIGRLLIVLQLLRDRSLHQPILVVSPWFEARRRAYQDELLKLSQTGDWSTWVEFFATGITAAADTTRQRISELLAFSTAAQTTVRSAGRRGVAERLAAELIGTPILTASRAAHDHDITHQAAMNALRTLVELDLLHERNRRGRATFVSNDVIAILSR